jgi:hypothetical protein
VIICKGNSILIREFEDFPWIFLTYSGQRFGAYSTIRRVGESIEVQDSKYLFTNETPISDLEENVEYEFFSYELGWRKKANQPS